MVVGGVGEGHHQAPAAGHVPRIVGDTTRGRSIDQDQGADTKKTYGRRSRSGSGKISCGDGGLGKVWVCAGKETALLRGVLRLRDTV